MPIFTRVLKNEYYDSVTLMSLTARLKKELKPKELVVVMATEMNKELMATVGFTDPALQALSPNDCVVGIITADNDTSDESILDTLVGELKSKSVSRGSGSNQTQKSYRTIPSAQGDFGANLAVISVPGQYAAREAAIALEQGLHVLMFSDNVSVEDEIQLKNRAKEKGLFLMGPDCGTAIINGVGLCFANQVHRGPIGLVAASGTGLQEVTVLIDRFGGGVSQAIGVGGRDLSHEVGGIMMLQGIQALAADPQTEVIVLVSKPPAPLVNQKIFATLEGVRKPVVVCFLEGTPPDSGAAPDPARLRFVYTLADAAASALEMAGMEAPRLTSLTPIQESLVEKFRRPGKDLRGLYCGGTLCAEALSLSRKSLKGVTSNVAKKDYEKMVDLKTSHGHCFVDLGDDFFTNGKPHPMIEPTIRLDRILQESKDPRTGVILLDFELGYGSHTDPVGTTLDTLAEAQKINPDLVFVAYVCGTEGDTQNLKAQEKQLADAGVLLAASNAQAVQLAASLVKE